MRVLLFLFLVGCADKNAAAKANHTAPQPVAQPAALEGELPVDTKDLRDDEKRTFARLIAKYPSACGKPHSLEQSLRTDSRCKRSLFAARYLVRLLKLHLLASEVEEQYELRFSSPKHEIDVAQSPLRGESFAPITIVEFSDFQCPHCKKLQPALERLLDEYRGQVKLVFKNFPLGVHPDAPTSAAAALAAGKQGKFWPFHDRLFGNQENHGMVFLEKIAKDLKLDLKKWKADLEAARPQVQKDRTEGEKVDVQATPTLFVSGRKYHGPTEFEDIKDWIEEELNR